MGLEKAQRSLLLRLKDKTTLVKCCLGGSLLLTPPFSGDIVKEEVVNESFRALSPFPSVGISEDTTFGERLQPESGVKSAKKYKSSRKSGKSPTSTRGVQSSLLLEDKKVPFTSKPLDGKTLTSSSCSTCSSCSSLSDGSVGEPPVLKKQKVKSTQSGVESGKRKLGLIIK